ncbi:MAG: LysR family transcriptional regulator [Deltaproteobacteria bacterium]|nr:LysR family transcriptional regulator [Deltaproteobacteria bacterium]
MDQMKVFYFVCKHKSVLQASRELHVTGSAVSQHIKALERELKASLFMRTNKSIILTRAGEKLFGAIAPFMQNISDTLKDMEEDSNSPRGALKMGAPVEFGINHLPKVLAEFRQAYPMVRFEITLATPSKLLDQLVANHLDLAFVDHGHAYKKSSPVSTLTIYREELLLVCSREYYRKSIKHDHSFENLSRRHFVDYVNHCAVLKRWFLHHFKRCPSDFDLVLSVESAHGIASSIRHHMGLGVVPRSAIKSELKSGTFTAITTPEPELVNEIMLTQLSAKKPSLAEKAFVRFYREHVRL